MSERSRGPEGASSPATTQNSPSAGDDIYAAAAASAAGRNAKRGTTARPARSAGSAGDAAEDRSQVAARARTGGSPTADGDGNRGGTAGDSGATGDAAARNGNTAGSGRDADTPAETTGRFGAVASSVLNRVRPGRSDSSAAGTASPGAGAKSADKPAPTGNGPATRLQAPQSAPTAAKPTANGAAAGSTAAGSTAAGSAGTAPAADPAAEPTAPLEREALTPVGAVTKAAEKQDAAKAEKAEKPRAGTPRGTRKARLRLSRLDPWSVMKTAFLFSIAAGIVMVVAVYAVWLVIGSSGLFDSVDSIVGSVLQSPTDTTPFRIEDYVNTQKVMGVTAFLACIDVVIFTALATLASFLYNLAATMLGGLEVTLAED